MPYIVLILGLALIYFALRKEKKFDNKPIFNDMLRTSLDKNETDYILEKLSLIEMRIEEIENSLILVDQELIQFKMNTSKDKEIIHKDNNQIPLVQEIENTVEDTENLKNESSNISLDKDLEVKTKIESNTVISENDTNKVIYELFDSGKSVDEIAEILRVGKGELLLRLGLRKHRK